MLSIPPATTRSTSPQRTPCAASITAFKPEPHTLLIVSAATVGGSPARSAACRAGAWPTPAESTLPRMTSSMSAGSTPARATASRTAIAPSSVTGNDESDPRNLPIGVRHAESMKASDMALVPLMHREIVATDRHLHPLRTL